MVSGRGRIGAGAAAGEVPGAGEERRTYEVPRLVIGAPASGSGKTTVATGLMAAFGARGVAVSPHKVGPDYIDPGYHALATGRPGRNLDPYLCGEERIAPLFLHGAAGCELAVVEGVMGLFDGASGLGEIGSTAQVAKLLRAPVVLVVDAASQSRSVAALVHGFASWDPGVRLGGVVLNRVGSDRHEKLLREALDEAGVPVLGVLHRADDLRVPSRHLGLVPAAERAAQAREWLSALASRVTTGCDLAALWALARSAPPLYAAPWDAGAEVAGAGIAGAEVAGAGTAGPAAGVGGSGPDAPGAAEPVVAVASGAAFTFAYPENAELLRAAGARVVPFDPLADEALPEGTAGVVLGGGFPEAYAAELSANEPLRRALAAFAGPIAAECAGLLYLVRSLDGRPMCGVLDAEAVMTDRLTLGYRQAVALADSVLAAPGTRLRGHEFHRTVVFPASGSDGLAARGGTAGAVRAGSAVTAAGRTAGGRPAGDAPGAVSAGPSRTAPAVPAAAAATGAPARGGAGSVTGAAGVRGAAGTPAVASAAWGFTPPAARREGFVQGSVHASYLHLHWAAEPSLALRFAERCAS